MNAVRTAVLQGIASRPSLSEVRPLLPPTAAPHILTLCLPAVKSEVALNFLSREGICVSSGSACATHARALSGALLAYGLTEEETDTAIRLSFSGESTGAEAEAFLSILEKALASLARMRK
jgi:cysteine desulfurase